ncbi:MAG TPA: hypothetical protein VGH47_00145 [Xanthobacteraceae bacterium]|jgi:hypothetical protein
MPITIADKFKCVQRELAMRQHVYPRLIEAGKLKPAAAEREIDVMAAIVEDYRRLSENPDFSEVP